MKRTLHKTLALAGVALLLATAAGEVWAAAAANEDPFYKGLQDRGLKSLMDAYLKEGASSTPTPTVGPTATAAAGSKLALANQTAQRAQAEKLIGDRENFFKKAAGEYAQAIDEMKVSLAKMAGEKTPEKGKADPKSELRLQIVQTRMTLAGMIFMNWLGPDLDILEVSDRRAGDRNRAAERLKEAKTQFGTALEEASQWLSEIDRLPDAERGKVVNAGYEAKLKNIRREAEFNDAWLRYYYAWILPKDYKPAGGEKTRQQLLKDAISTFQGYTALPDKVSAKWFAYLVIGLCHRELGQYPDSISALNEAGGAKSQAPESLKIRIVFEQALALLRKGDLKEARTVIDNGRGLYGEAKITAVTPYGPALPLLEAESYILESKAKDNNEELKAKGMKIFQEMNARGSAWAVAVGGVLAALVGDAGKPEEMEPILVWNLANKNLNEAQASKDKAKYEEALRLYKLYCTKVKPEDPNYVGALYSSAACLLTLERSTEAAPVFKDVAERFPKYAYAKNAAVLVLSTLAKAYDQTPTEEVRQQYEDALAWFVGKWFEIDPEQQYFYAFILYKGQKFQQAVEQFRKVPETSEHYIDARYWIPLCRMENFRDKTLATHDAKLILPEARDVTQSLRDFAAYSQTAKVLDPKLPEDADKEAKAKAEKDKAEKEKTVKEWGRTALLAAADILLYPEMTKNEAQEALKVIDQVEKAYTLTDDEKGQILNLRINAYQKVGELDKALAVLQQFLKGAKPDEAGQVLSGLFEAIVADVKRLIIPDKKAAALKVEAAEKLGDQYIEWLQANGGSDKANMIEQSRYNVSELYLATEDYERALKIYREIVGEAYPPPEPLKVPGVFGLARSYEALGDKAADAKQAEPQYTKAFNYWKVLADAESGQGKEKNLGRIWLYRYHMYWCQYKLGKKDEVRAGLKALKIMSNASKEPVGGKDILLQRKFTELENAVGG